MPVKGIRIVIEIEVQSRCLVLQNLIMEYVTVVEIEFAFEAADAIFFGSVSLLVSPVCPPRLRCQNFKCWNTIVFVNQLPAVGLFVI